jgi:hypothetical protein
MHYVCFHYEFEHSAGGSTDVDADCGVPGCPSAMLADPYGDPQCHALTASILESLRVEEPIPGAVLDLDQLGRVTVRDGESAFLINVARLTRRTQ